MILFWETKIFFQVTNFPNANVIEIGMLKVSWKYYVLFEFTYLKKRIQRPEFPNEIFDYES